MSAASLYDGIMAGSYDGKIRDICGVADEVAPSVVIRWAHEMDNSNKRYLWSQWTPSQYIGAYRHFVSVCRSSARKLKFMWSPRGEDNLKSYYPGSQYVDYVGFSVFSYQKYEQAVFGKVLTLDQHTRKPYNLLLGYNKPIYIAEFGCNGDEVFVEKCISEMPRVADRYQGIVSVVYFNEVETYPWPAGFGLPDWRDEKKLFGR
jgi:beta-mannanase